MAVAPTSSSGQGFSPLGVSVGVCGYRSECIKYRGRFYKVCPTSAEDLSCALHALVGVKNDRGWYSCSGTSSMRPREDFVLRLQKAITYDQNDHIIFDESFPHLREKYINVIRDFVGNFLKRSSFFHSSLNKPQELHDEWLSIEPQSSEKEEEFLLSKKVFDCYLECISKEPYLFEVAEILLQAHIYGLNVRVITPSMERNDNSIVCPGELVDQNADEKEIIYIYRSKNFAHFERCEPVEESDESEVYFQQAKDYLLTAISWVFGWVILLLCMVYSFILRMFESDLTAGTYDAESHSTLV